MLEKLLETAAFSRRFPDKKGVSVLKKIFIIVIAILVFGEGMAYGAEAYKGWADLWNYGAYHATNFESNNFKTGIARIEGRLGFYTPELWKDVALMPYVAYIGVASGDNNYWNNDIAGGVGLRMYPFRAGGAGWVKAIKLYAETLSVSYLKDTNTAAGLPTNDTRLGLDLWYEWNQKQENADNANFDFSKPWGETWTNISYRTTNFTQNNFNNVVMYAQFKNGLYLGGQKGSILFEPYLRTDLNLSGKNDFWLNNFVYGLGMRFQPFRKTDSKINPLLYKLKIFFEVLGISYLSAKPQDGRPNTDIRFGVDFSLGR
ncbi:MAG: hypothetical protein NT099_01620 [Candidatus Saganbacteria bacterium]|nr:hypothetical protein [Candidatus Saganbacteria bacterium]